MTGDTQTRVSPLRPSDPKQLGPYQLLGRIGRGGMGTVYLADTSAGERAAVKVINPDLADDGSFRDRFRREVEAARRVRRFCTAPVLDAQLDGEPLFIVTEYVDGPNLDEFVRASGPMRGSHLEHLAVGVATALTAIHGAGVVHRDLKPANVLLSSLGPRVIDFGIARALDTVAEATRTGQFIGTPAYMAPEVISGTRAAPASDVFSWGCVVAYAGTGRAPFSGPTVPAVLYKITNENPDLEGLDGGLRALVEQALAKDPRRRPAAQEVLNRLVGQEHASTEQVADTMRRTWPESSPLPRDVTLEEGPPPARPQGPPPGGRPTSPQAPAQPAYDQAPPTRQDSAPPSPPGHGTREERLVKRTAIAMIAGFIVMLGAVAVIALNRSGGPPDNLTLVYGEDFENVGGNWGSAYTPLGYGYFGGGFRIDATDSSQIQLKEAPYREWPPNRALISVQARAVSGPQYGQFGVWCRGDDTGAYPGYQFLVRLDGKGASIRKVTGDNSSNASSKELVQQDTAKGFNPGETNLLQAACDQDGRQVNLRLWANGDLAAEITDRDNPLSPQGNTGFVASRGDGGSGGNVSVVYDNFEISKIND